MTIMLNITILQQIMHMPIQTVSRERTELVIVGIEMA